MKKRLSNIKIRAHASAGDEYEGHQDEQVKLKRK